MNPTFLEALQKILEKEQYKIAEPMSSHITFRVGGNADCYIKPSIQQLPEVLKLCKQYQQPFMVIGNGSNLLVGDKGIRGVVIELGKPASAVRIEENKVIAEAGAMLSAVARQAAREGLSGMEFASGIPGTIGGAVVMNAGAYGGEMKDIVVETKVIHNGKIETISNKASDFGYRKSKIMSENMIVVETTLSLEKGNKEDIQSKMSELLTQRNSKQPVELPSAGSTFKRPEGYFAAKLIDDSGLRGYSVGKAQVSPKHCGFVVNNGGATANDVLTLMHNVSNIVEDKFGVKLEPEVRIIGE